MRDFCVTVFLFILIGCDQGNPVDGKQPFQVTVCSQDGAPVEGATISGGIDWDFFREQTNASGIAMLPGYARSLDATIYRTNFLPLPITKIAPRVYMIKQTLKRLDLIGNASGAAVRFGKSELITLDYVGYYHRYTYNAKSITEVFTRQLHDSAVAIRQIRLFGDTLWFTTHNSGVYVFDISNPSSPRMLHHLRIPGYLGPFVKKDSVVVFGDMWSAGPVRVVVYQSSGQFREVASVKNYIVRNMSQVGSTLILLGYGDTALAAFDMSDPLNPRLVNNGLEWGNWAGFFYGQYTILASPYRSGGGNPMRPCLALNLADPSSPVRVSEFGADSWISGLASENLAFGNYYDDPQTVSILAGSIYDNFKTVATVSEGTIDGIGGSCPPYFIIGNKLWRLVDR